MSLKSGSITFVGHQGAGCINSGDVWDSFLRETHKAYAKFPLGAPLDVHCICIVLEYDPASQGKVAVAISCIDDQGNRCKTAKVGSEVLQLTPVSPRCYDINSYVAM